MKKTAAFFLFILFAFLAQAQSFSIYQNINTSNGLPSNYVLASAEDENGFLWVGTDKGLCRYDGFHWQVWDKDDGLPGNYINLVLPDKQGGLWLGISDKGYFHFRVATGNVQALPLLKTPLLSSLQTDKAGNLYAELLEAGAHKAYLFHPASFTKPSLVFSWQNGLPALLRGDAKSKQIYCLSASVKDIPKIKSRWKGQWPLRTKLLAQPYFTGGSAYYVSDSVVVTSTDCYFLSTQGGLVKKEALFPPGNNYAFTCATDSGLYVYDIKTGYYFFDKQGNKKFYNRRSGLGTDYVNNIYQTSDGTIIISTLGAGLQLIKTRYRKTYFTNNNTVKTIISSSNGWYVLAGNQVYQKAATSTNLTLLGETVSSTLNLGKWNDTLVAGTLRGVAFYKESGTNLKQLGLLELTAGVSSIIRDGQHYIAGTYGSGILPFRFNKKEKTTPAYPLFIIEKLVPLTHGFAALSYEDGVLLTDTKTSVHVQLSQKDGLLSNSVYSVYQRRDTLWIGTKGGIAIFSKGAVSKTLRFPDGQKLEKSLAVFHSKDGNLWVVSNRNLYRSDSNGLRPLSSFPLISDDDVVTTAVYDAATDELGIGSNKTFSVITMAAVQPNTTVSAPRLTGIVLDGESKTAYSLLVPFDFTNLRFNMAPLSSLPFSQSHFYYQLQGHSDAWIELKDSLMISFTALRPGSYKLLGKSVNRDGYESSPVLLAPFQVQKPYWLRWPFLLLCLVTIVGITVLLLKGIEKAKRQKKEAALLLQQTIQSERQRIAKDLHDHLGTNLTTIIAQSDTIETRLHKGDVQQASQTVQHLSSQSRETMNVLREAIWAVQESEHSMEDFLLRIRTFLQRFFDATSIQWEVKSSVPEKQVLSPTKTLHLFRIIQEASQNISKHSGATKAQYNFSVSHNKLEVVIRDNGQGFSGGKLDTNGIVNIQERAGQLGGKMTLVTSPFVIITVTVPL